MEARFEGIETVAEELMEICGAASISLGVSRKGRTICSKSVGYLDVHKRLPAGSRTAYATASVSKSFLSAATGMLVADGRLDWREPIKTYLPDFDPVHDCNIGRYANLIDILCHSSGLAPHDLLHSGPFGLSISDRRDLVKLVNHLPTSTPEGPRFRRCWQYNNIVVALAAEIIEKVSGQSYATFLEEQIFHRLGMTASCATKRHLTVKDNIALPYAKLSDGSMCQLRSMGFTDEWSPTSISCGVWSSTEDLLIWANEIMKSLKWEEETGSDSHPGKRPNCLREMPTILNGFHPQPPRDEYQSPCAYALGWLKVQLPSSLLGYLSFNKELRATGADRKYVLGANSEPLEVIMHNGKLPGYNSVVMMFPESESAVVVLSNGGTDGDPSDWLARILAQRLFNLTPEVDIIQAARAEALLSRRWFEDSLMRGWRENRTEPQRPQKILDYVGTYENDEFGTTIHIMDNGDACKVYFNQRPDTSYPLVYYCGDTYSFLPATRDDWLRDSMLEWFHYSTGLLRFCKDDDTGVHNLYWRWSSREEGSWFRRRRLPNKQIN